MSHFEKVDTPRIVGTWQLVSVTIESGSDLTHPMGDRPKGILIYAENNRYSVQLMPTHRPRCAVDDFLRCTPEEIVANAREVVSYFGRFELNEAAGYIIHHIEGCLFPNWEGQAHKRFYELAGSRLILRSEAMDLGGQKSVAVIEWERT